MRLLSILCTASFLATSGHCLAESTKDLSPQPVQLHFGWQPGMTADVVATTRMSMKHAGTDTPGDDVAQAATIAYRLHTTIRGKDLQVSFDSFRANGTPVPADATGTLRSVYPSFIVTDAGDFADVDGDGSSPLLDDIRKTDGPEIRAVLPGATPDRMLRVTAAAIWNGLVGAWNHVELRPGEETTKTRSGTSALTGGDVSVATTYRVNGETPCVRSGVARRCVEVTLSTDLAPRPFEGMLQRLTAMARQTDPGFSAEFEGARATMTTVIEPDGMIPHHSLRVTTISMRTTEHGQPSHLDAVRTEESTIDFR